MSTFWRWQHSEDVNILKIYFVTLTNFVLQKGKQNMWTTATFITQVSSFICKRKAIPLQAWTGPGGSRSLRLPDFKTIGPWRCYGCQPYAPAAITPSNIHGTHFCYRLSRPQGHSAAGSIVSVKNSNDTIGNRTHDLPPSLLVKGKTNGKVHLITFREGLEGE
jgi:hypothetical protein